MPPLRTVTAVTRPEPAPLNGRGATAALVVTSERPRGATRKGTRNAYTPGPLEFGVATTAPRIETSEPKFDASAGGSAATWAAVSDNVTCTVCDEPAATVTVFGDAAIAAPSELPLNEPAI